MTQVNRESILAALIVLRDRVEAGIFPKFGICDSVEDILADELGRGLSDDEADVLNEEFLGRLFRRWPHFSGHVFFPVPGVAGHTAAASFINHAADDGRWTGEYGELRLDLLDHCIKELS